jgi:hypothetical protein
VIPEPTTRPRPAMRDVVCRAMTIWAKISRVWRETAHRLRQDTPFPSTCIEAKLLDRVIALGPLDGSVSDSSVASTMFSTSIVDAENFRVADPELRSMARSCTGTTHAAGPESARLRLRSVAPVADRRGYAA